MRFKADDGSDFPEWISRSLSDYVRRVTRKNNDQSDIPLTISSLDGLVDQRSYFHKTVASKDLSNYLLLKRGEFAYNKSHSVGFPFGSIKRLENFDQGALSTLYICFALTDEKLVNSEFLKHYWDSQRWVPEVSTICAEGARNHGLLNVSTSDFFEISIILPISLLEQKKIAAFLSSVDSTIALCQRKLDLLTQAKKALMQQIFTQKLRFTADDGSDFPEWEQKKLGDIAEKIDRKATSESTADIRMISQGEGFILQSRKYSRENAGKSLSKYLLLKKNEFAYNHGASKAKPFGVTYRLVESSEARVPYVYHAFSITKGDLGFWSYALNTESIEHQLQKIITSGVRMDGLLNISFEAYMSVSIPFPCVAEQQKIAACLSSADALIDQARAELVQWQEVKKSLLQQMFV